MGGATTAPKVTFSKHRYIALGVHLVSSTSPVVMEYPTAPRPGNLQRAAWRQKCWRLLADHLRKEPEYREGANPLLISELESQLGIFIEPIQVRLMPDSQDGYMWSFLPEREHLFTKQLSKHSIGLYMVLCREVGKSFEAVATGASNLASPEEPNKVQ
jgi:hypothetical protein